MEIISIMSKAPASKKKREITPEHRAKLMQSLAKARVARIEQARVKRAEGPAGKKKRKEEQELPDIIEELLRQRVIDGSITDGAATSILNRHLQTTDNNDSGFTTMDGALERLRAVTGEIRASRRALPPGSRKQLDKLIGEC